MYDIDDLLINSDIRNKLISKVDVLDKVKDLLLLPNTDFATTGQVARYYEVDIEVINTICNRNREELLEDGYKVFKRDKVINLLNVQDVHLKKYRGKTVIELQDGEPVVIPNRGLRLFPRRAILRVGMLLRDSRIAKKVRTQLLNIEEKTSLKTKIVDLDKEKQLVLDAVFGSDTPTRTQAIAELLDFKNKHIQKVENKLKVSENKNDALVKGELKWNDRESINRMVRKIAMNVFHKHGRYAYRVAWDKVRAHLLYKHNISVTRRLSYQPKEATIFDVLKPEEMKLLVQSCIALCDQYKINIDEILVKSA